MDKILEALELVAVERSNKYRDLANQMVMDLDGADERQVAEYIATHDADMRKVLGVSDLASKDANPELANEYFTLLKRGRAMQDPDQASRKDYYNEDLKDIDHFMELLGVRKEGGSYDNDTRSAFTNPDDPAYYGNISKDDLQLAALQDGYENADELLSAIGQAGALYQRGRQARGYNADNSTDVGAWVADLAQEIGLPRVREARLAGRDWTKEDLFGDMAELGLNFVPGVGLVSKGGKWVAKIPNQYVGKALNALFMTGDNLAVPAGSQLMDMALYGDDDPRGEWNSGRVGAQFGGIVAARMGLKSLGQTGKHLLAAREGESPAREAARGFSEFINSIGDKTDDVIARRQAMLDRKAELAKSRQNVAMQGDRDIISIKSTSTPEDLVNADNYRILTEEAKRIAKSDKARQEYREAVARQEPVAKLTNPTFSRNPDGSVNITAPIKRGVPQNNDVTWADEPINRTTPAKPNVDANGNETWVVDPSKANYPLETWRKAGEGLAQAETDQAIADAYKIANDAGSKEIVQLPNGKFIYQDRIKEGNIEFPGMDYKFPKTEPINSVEFSYEPSLTPKSYKEPGMTIIEGGTALKPVDRNKAVLAEINKDPVISRTLNPWRTGALETARDYAANVGANAAAREGAVGQGLKMDEKRQNAMWNSYMAKLRPLVADADVSSEEKKRRVDAIMNVMSFGLDNIPDDVFAANPRIYHAIAAQLGEPAWKHRTEPEDPMPTTSFSSYDESIYVPNSASSTY